MNRFARVLLVLASLTGTGQADAQQPVPSDGWNSPRAMELIARAAERRQVVQSDTGLVNYSADARIFVYFYLDRTDIEQRNLVKTDQLALEVYWRHPADTKQRIIGWRDEKSLPTNINYHLDHLTVVQENFGDVIVIGDGDEVRDVLHPAAPEGTSYYEYRLADSLTLRLPGTPDPVRVYELEVRPLDESQPAFVGSVFVERRAGDIVRMDFTFTESSYVDRYLDYINISLDNGLWRGRFWLPNEQRVEVRRRLPQLDLPAGSVIRIAARVGNYQFNQPFNDFLFTGPPVVALPQDQREAFEFEEEIDAELRAEGIGSTVELGEIQRQARELVRQQALERATQTGIRLPSASHVLRYNRAEGLFLGLGATLFTRDDFQLGGLGGWAFGPDHLNASLTAASQLGDLSLALKGYLNQPRDLGIGHTASGAMNSLTALVAGRDYRDLFYTDGVSVQAQKPIDELWNWSAEARFENQRSAQREASFSLADHHFRSVRRIDQKGVDDATAIALGFGVNRRTPVGLDRWWDARLEATAGRTQLGEGCDGPLNIPCESAQYNWGTLQGDATGGVMLGDSAEFKIRGRAGLAFGQLPVQELFLIGGRGTVPGHRYRSHGGDLYTIVDANLSRNLAAPWLTGRVSAAAGWISTSSVSRGALRRWGAQPADSPIGSVGVGLGIFYDILWVDVARGIGPGGSWELIIEADRGFWDFL